MRGVARTEIVLKIAAVICCLPIATKVIAAFAGYGFGGEMGTEHALSQFVPDNPMNEMVVPHGVEMEKMFDAVYGKGNRGPEQLALLAVYEGSGEKVGRLLGVLYYPWGENKPCVFQRYDADWMRGTYPYQVVGAPLAPFPACYSGYALKGVTVPFYAGKRDIITYVRMRASRIPPEMNFPLGLQQFTTTRYVECDNPWWEQLFLLCPSYEPDRYAVSYASDWFAAYGENRR